MLEIIRELIVLTKEKKKEEAYRAQLMKMPLNFEALDYLASKYKDKKITVQVEGNASITIEPIVNNAAKIPSFREKFEAAHK